MRLSPTLSVYIARQFLLAFVTVLLVIMGIILLFDVIELIRRAAGRPELGFGLLLAMALLKLPQMTHTIMPFGVMIGAMIAFWRLTRTHELVVARAAGVSVWQFLAPVLIATLALGVVEITAFNPLAASMYARFERMQNALLTNRGNALDVSEVGLWLREGYGKDHGGGQVVVHAEDVRQEGLVLYLGDVHIFIYDKPDHFSRRLSAAKARLVAGAFEMQDVWLMTPGKPGEHFDTMTLPTRLTLERVHDNFASPETLSFWQLPGFIAFFEKAGFSAPKHRMYLQSLIASPVLYCGMVLVAALFSLKPNTRSGGLVGRVAAGVATGFILYFFSKIIYAFGLSQTIPQVLAAWAPAMMAGFAGLGGLFHLEDG
ncbi:MAG: LPS export ABC transporter permease LptG [Magnetospirillum sp.]|nr:LPS export ABC transporter permease LptG [Magnetospirillum sp.]